jgi:hypothetical protein
MDCLVVPIDNLGGSRLFGPYYVGVRGPKWLNAIRVEK